MVTAPTGAAVRDIINISTRRNPGIQLILYPAKVQGEGAAESVAEGLRRLDALGLDVIIVGRGGGSIEDLWAFNEEIVARAIFSCRTPVVSAVGHETDTTIADCVADLRAPTPSAAAELAVMDMRTVLTRLDSCGEQLERMMMFRIEKYRMKLEKYRTELEHAGPEQRIREQRQRAADMEDAFIQKMNQILQERRYRMSVYIERMKSSSPLEKMSRGYAAVTDSQGKRVYSVTQVKNEDTLELFVADGRIRARVAETEPLKLFEQPR